MIFAIRPVHSQDNPTNSSFCYFNEHALLQISKMKFITLFATLFTSSALAVPTPDGTFKMMTSSAQLPLLSHTQ